MMRLAEGDKAVTVAGASRGDEIGEMAKAVQVFKDNAIAMDRMRSEQEEGKQRAELEKRRAMGNLADDFETSVRGAVQIVSTAARELQSTAQPMSTTAEQTKQRSLTVASASDQATSNVQTVAAAAEELSASISEIGRQVAQASSMVSR